MHIRMVQYQPRVWYIPRSVALAAVVTQYTKARWVAIRLTGFSLVALQEILPCRVEVEEWVC